ncbi:tumor necrosis factor ligand superfamily member 18 [Nycticebus coucang]|uniref:tumor necrosis factor ligand superfamily member 18 n=1 Tax=Nycticebus coucang TaxID=9470 RepID=UPI00234D4F53|nr:tumor necrosis factor ligand superfamily member 18 [Nycticebus coucang]
MSLNHMENMPLNNSSLQGAQRSSWKPWIICMPAVLILSLCFIIIPIFYSFQTATEPCLAKFGPLPSTWQMTPREPPCVNSLPDWKLEILQNGLYLIYGQVAPSTTYKGVAPFAMQLRKNEAMIQTLTYNSTIHNVGGTYEFHAGDIIDLIFNDEHQVLKNNTYWGIVLLANLRFIS